MRDHLRIGKTRAYKQRRQRIHCVALRAQREGENDVTAMVHRLGMFNNTRNTDNHSIAGIDVMGMGQVHNMDGVVPVMGYVMVFGDCILCHHVFAFNPHKVPSMRVKGTREPVCKNCMDALIAKEEAAGIEPKRYAPDAYDPLPEEEL